MKLKKIINKILLGIIISVGSAILIAGMTLEVKQHFKVNYELPQSIKSIQKHCNIKDSLNIEKNKEQNKFIFENRVIIRKQQKNDSLLNQQLKNISLSLNILLKNNKQAAKELENLKQLLNNNTFVENIKK